MMADLPDSFAGFPPTIGELRGDNDAATWTPREALIALLREIDEGKSAPEMLVVCWRDGPKQTVHFRSAGPDVLASIGLLAHVQGRLADG